MSETEIREDTQPLMPAPVPPREQDRTVRRGGCGCWIPAILTLLLVAALVTVGLFLPPVNLYERLFGTQYAMLSADANAVAADGITLIVDPANPGSEYGVALNAVPMEALNTASADAQTVNTILAAAPPALALQSPVYRIDTTGVQPDEVTLSITVPPTAGSPDILDVYGYDTDTNTWRFVPTQIDANGALTTTVEEVPEYAALFQAGPQDQPAVLVAYDVTQTLPQDVADLATIVSPGGLQPTLEGKLTGSLAAGFDNNAGYLTLPVIRNFTDARAVDPETVSTILGNSVLRAEHVTQLTAFASGGYDGVLIDYRDLPEEQRDNFSLFIRDLGTNLDSLGLLLGVVVPAAENVAGTWDTSAYDWRAIGAAADYVQIELGDDPASYTPGADRPVEAMLRWAVGEIERSKILLGLSSQSVQEVNGAFSPISYPEALAALGDVQVEAQENEAGIVEPGTEIRAELDGYEAETGVDEAIQAPYIDYLEDGSPVARVWLATAEALRFRMDRTLPFALGGVAFDDLLNAEVAEGVLETIFNYKVQLPSAVGGARELALRWRIESADGVVGEVTTGLNEPLVATIDAADGNYAINVDIIGGQEEVPRSGVAVAVFAPTLTPTPRPTATPSPTPEPTVVAAAPAPQAAAPAAPAAPVSNSAGAIVVGNFEYGGHVTNPATGAAEAMRRAGMSWMKVQLVYNSGMDPSVAAGYINDAHSRGFKILLGIVGRPNELAAGGAGYINQYASFVGGVAALGPDAIEVWNEPNLDREWPTGQISGAAYVEVLRPSYQAIKGANGSVMVISGAPAPTGAEAAFPGQVMNDDRWIGEVVAAGGLQYMDCLGAHYNEGIVGPTQRSGDPRDGYYTRYFWGMVDTYWSLIGGQKPICFTELGYLTPEGFGPLPSFFSWAQNVTLNQQATWLAEAAALASQSGKVRLMIIWNIDFTVYGADPQAGYAIIRPGGGCPACDALAAARQ